MNINNAYDLCCYMLQFRLRVLNELKLHFRKVFKFLNVLGTIIL